MNTKKYMHQRRLLVVSIIVGLTVSVANAGGPVYSRYGLGELFYFAGSRSYAMGDAGIGLLGDGFINQINPAGLALISATRFSGMFEYSNYSSTDPSGSARYARGDFGGLSVAIPASKDYGVVLLAELTPYSTVNYEISRDDSQLGISSNQEFIGSGGISRFDLGSSISITQNLHAGFKLNYLAGTILETTKINFADNTYSNSVLTLSDHYSGVLFTFGASYSGVGDLVGSSFLKSLVLGFVVETPTSLDVREDHLTATAQQYDTTSTQFGKADIPTFFGIGASYALADRYVFAADLAMQDWSNAKNFGLHPAELRNSTRFGGGFEVRPSKDASTYWEHVIYRAGFYYNSSYIQVDGQPINAMFATVGLGLPIGADSHLNLGFQIGVNGTNQNDLQKDTIFRLTASISASELWFVRIDEE